MQIKQLESVPGQPLLEHMGKHIHPTQAGQEAVRVARAVEGELALTFTPAMEMNKNEAIKQAVEAGLGLGVVSLHTVKAELASGQLGKLLLSGNVETVSCSLPLDRPTGAIS